MPRLDASGFVLAAVLGAGCGRVGFGALSGNGESGTDATSAGDGAPGDVAADASADPSLFVWLQMETDPVADPLVDSSPYHHDVACVAGAGCPTRVAGELGSGYAFPSGQQLVVDAAITSPPITAAAWLYLPAAPTDYSSSVCEPVGNTGDDSFCLSVAPTGTTDYYSSDVGTIDRLYGNQFSLNTWHHLALRYDGTSKQGFLDGTLDASDSVTIPFTPAASIYVGANSDGSPEYFFPGTIDDVRIYTRLLSDQEIFQLAHP